MPIEPSCRAQQSHAVQKKRLQNAGAKIIVCNEVREVHVKIAVYPGSFDPITNGHLDIVRRANNTPYLYGDLIAPVSAIPTGDMRLSGADGFAFVDS